MALSPAVQAIAKTGARPMRVLQRACSGKSCEECESCRKKKPLQREAAGGRGGNVPASYNAPSALTGGGVHLPVQLRQALGPLYGSDFSGVRIHHDAASHAAAREVNARAFTLGQHVHFAAGEYRPGHQDGLRLLAHELGHTVQQRHAGDVDSGTEVEIGRADSALEREADAAADAVLDGRKARLSSIGAGGVQAKLLQRQLGTAAGGSESASVDRKVDENTIVHITRTVTEKKCTLDTDPDSTPTDKIFYWDKDANAIGLNYKICNGRVQLSTKGEISYDKVIDSAKNLLTTLQKNPALGQDLGNLLNDRLSAATISTSGDVTLTVDGILSASVQTGSTTGTQNQQYNVRGVLKITPKGMSFTVTGGVDFSKTPLQSTTTYTLEGKVATEHFAVDLKYEQIDTSKAGGAATSKGQTTLGVDVPLPDVGPLSGVTLGPTVTFDEHGNPTIGGGLKGHFGKPETTPRVRCFKCNCPPPLPEYSCTKEVTAHREPVTKEAAKDSTVKLLYDYNSAVPANAADFKSHVSSIAALVGQGYKVEHIWGYASPEGSLDTPKPPVPGFKGNIALSGRRASQARGEISTAAPGAALPEAEGKGEQLGDLDGTGDTADKDITPDLVKLLQSKTSDDERLDVLGVEESVRNDAAKKAQAIADINAFIEGRDAKGLKLAQRPRWGKVFPFLRRVEVALHHDPVIEMNPVAASNKKQNCEDADIAYARANMPALPPERRLPKEECGT
ncbi:MAG TPA: DUF4157 domain-containing protein [Micropepsaceae bacterium]